MYKFVLLNPDPHLSYEKDLQQAEENLNQLVLDGWQLQQIITPADSMGHIVALLYREY